MQRRAQSILRALQPRSDRLLNPALVRALPEAGVTAFKCATLDELEVALHTAGSTPTDVLVAYPLHPAAVAAATRLASAHPRSALRLLLDSPEHARRVDAALSGAPIRLTALLDVDVGMARTGTPAPSWAVPELTNLDPVGLHGYEGHPAWHDGPAADWSTGEGARQPAAVPRSEDGG